VAICIDDSPAIFAAAVSLRHFNAVPGSIVAIAGGPPMDAWYIALLLLLAILTAAGVLLCARLQRRS
jgi:hypothetical protein